MILIPYDILLNIIDELGRAEDFSSLRSLSLTCRQAVAPCQKVIFRKVEIFAKIVSPKIDRTVNNLASVIAESPHLARYIRSLRCVLGKLLIQDNHCMRVLSQLLAQLDQLEDLCLEGWLFLDWNIFRKSRSPAALRFVGAVQDAMKSPRLRRLRAVRVRALPVTNFVERAKLLDFTAHLAAPECLNLEIIEPSVVHDVLYPSATRTSAIKVRQYHSDYGKYGQQSIVPWLSGADFGDMKSLSFFAINQNFRSDLPMLRSVRKLKELRVSIIFDNEMEVVDQTMDFIAHSHTLVSLTIRLFNPRPQRTKAQQNLGPSFDTALLSLNDGLSALSGSNVVERLEITLEDRERTIPDSTYASGTDHGKKQHLYRLGTIINLSGFPHLRAFTFILKVFVKGTDDLGEDYNILKQLLSSSVFGQLRAVEGVDLHDSVTLGVS